MELELLTIADAIEKVNEKEYDNIETLRDHGVHVIKLTQVELCIPVENGDKLVRYPIFDEDGIRGSMDELRKEADQLGVTGKIQLFAEWREDEGGRSGDKVGDEFCCELDEAMSDANRAKYTRAVLTEAIRQIDIDLSYNDLEAVTKLNISEIENFVSEDALDRIAETHNYKEPS